MLFAAVIVALATSLIFMIALRPLAESVGLVDRPGGRKSHVGDVPLVGGPSMFLAFLVGIALLPESTPQLAFLPLAASLLVVVGLIDDRYSLPAGIRLVAQVTAVMIMVFGSGLIVRSIGDPLGIGLINLGPLALIFTLLVTLTVINSFNLIDGVDGLAGSIAFVSLLSLVTIAGFGSSITGVALVVLAAVFGFLLFNFPVLANRAVRSFMGDSGSTLLGLVVVWLTIRISQGPDAVVSPVVCLWFAALPLFDLFTCFVRRILRGVSPFRPGRDHFHHTLKRGGLRVRQVLGVLSGIHIFYSVLGLIAHFSGASDALSFWVWVAMGLFQHRVIRKIAVSHRLGMRQVRNSEGVY